MDVTFIDRLEVATIIGVAAWERAIRQRLLVDVELGDDLSAPGRSDKLSDANDYAAIAARVAAIAEAAQFRLVEAFAEAVAADLLGRFQPAWVRITVSKPGAVPGARGVGVRIERGSPAS